MDGALGHAELVARIVCGVREEERGRVRETDVFGGESDESARDVERVLAALEHAREPVDGGVRVAAAHGFVECGDDVVVLLAGFVVEEVGFLEDGFNEGNGDGIALSTRSLQRIQGHAGVAVGHVGDEGDDVVGDFHASSAETVVGVDERAAEERRDGIFPEPLEHEYPRA